jgi:hypothetical protein
LYNAYRDSNSFSCFILRSITQLWINGPSVSNQITSNPFGILCWVLFVNAFAFVHHVFFVRTKSKTEVLQSGVCLDLIGQNSSVTVLQLVGLDVFAAVLQLFYVSVLQRRAEERMMPSRVSERGGGVRDADTERRDEATVETPAARLEVFDFQHNSSNPDFDLALSLGTFWLLDLESHTRLWKRLTQTQNSNILALDHVLSFRRQEDLSGLGLSAVDVAS